MFPNSWIDYNKNQVERILGPIQTEQGTVCVRDISMILSLWRYPTPSVSDYDSYYQSFEDLGEKRDSLSFDEFMKVPCWLDEWDENLCAFLTKETLYRTGYTKQF